MKLDEAEKIKSVVENKKYIEQLVETVSKVLVEAFENIKIEDVNMFMLGYCKGINVFANEMIKRFFICQEKKRREVNYIAERLKDEEMKEQKAVEIIKEYRGLFPSANNEDESLDEAIKALEEIKQYHAIGTVEECRYAVQKQKAYKWERGIDDDIRCPFCATITKKTVKSRYCSFCGQRLE